MTMRKPSAMAVILLTALSLSACIVDRDRDYRGDGGRHHHWNNNNDDDHDWNGDGWQGNGGGWNRRR